MVGGRNPPHPRDIACTAVNDQPDALVWFTRLLSMHPGIDKQAHQEHQSLPGPQGDTPRSGTTTGRSSRPPVAAAGQPGIGCCNVAVCSGGQVSRGPSGRASAAASDWRDRGVRGYPIHGGAVRWPRRVPHSDTRGSRILPSGSSQVGCSAGALSSDGDEGRSRQHGRVSSWGRNTFMSDCSRSPGPRSC